METSDQIRRENLAAIVDGCGGVTRLADRLDRSPSQVSQWLNASIDAKSGKPRTISGRSARYIEQRLGKPNGWMDQSHGKPPKEAVGCDPKFLPFADASASEIEMAAKMIREIRNTYRPAPESEAESESESGGGKKHNPFPGPPRAGFFVSDTQRRPTGQNRPWGDCSEIISASLLTGD